MTLVAALSSCTTQIEQNLSPEEEERKQIAQTAAVEYLRDLCSKKFSARITKSFLRPNQHGFADLGVWFIYVDNECGDSIDRFLSLRTRGWHPCL